MRMHLFEANESAVGLKLVHEIDQHDDSLERSSTAPTTRQIQIVHFVEWMIQ